MIDWIKDHVTDILADRAIARARSRRRSNGGLHALVVPPTRMGSVGDAAMIVATQAVLKSKGFEKIDIALGNDIASTVAFDTYIGDEGYFRDGRRSVRLRLLNALGNYSHVVMIGADCIDGIYGSEYMNRRIELIAAAAKVGAVTRILGSSFSATPAPNSVACLRDMPKSISVFARDPVSRQRMISLLRRPIKQSADLAFLCPSDSQHPEIRSILSWMQVQRQANRKIIALNINRLIDEKLPGFGEAHRAIVNAIVGAGHAIILVPHDKRGEKNDKHFLDAATSHLLDDSVTRVHAVTSWHPSRIKSVLAGVDLLVTSRMHAAILAAGEGRPSLCFVYQGKFEGLYDLLGLDKQKLLLSPDQLLSDPDGTASHVMRVLDDIASYERTLSASLPSVQALAMRNFNEIIPERMDR